MPQIRAFVALPLGENAHRALADSIRSARSLPRARLRAVPRENLHLTLRFLGDVDADAVPALMARLRDALAGLRPFSCRLESLIALPSPGRARLFAARLADETDGPGLHELARRVEQVAVAAGFPHEPRAFLPHVTLARVRGAPLRNVVLPPEAPRVPVEVDAIALVRSHLSREGSRYEVLASLPLALPDPAPRTAP